MKCRVCRSSVSDTEAPCNCGYDFSKEEISNQGAIRAYLEQANGWVEKVRRVGRIHEVQCKKHGTALPGPGDSGWTMGKTANLLRVSAATVSRRVEMNKALDQYPALEQCETENEARRKLEEIRGSSGRSFDSEDELQQYLETNWNQTELGRDWKLVRNGKYDTREVGIIDLLARHRREPHWLVVELKVRRSTDAAVGQLLRYMGWVKENRAKDNEVIQGLVISKSASKKILYALECVPNTELRLYYWQDGVFELKPTSLNQYILEQLKKKMPREKFLSMLGSALPTPQSAIR